MRILLIDTCTERGVIAYGQPSEILFAKELPFGPLQSKFLMPDLVDSLLPFGNPPPVDVVGVGIGPGSYTGIRLGVSVAQALSYSWKIPLVGVPSLEGFVPSACDVHYAALFDARIGGVYFQKGWRGSKSIIYQSEPQVFPLSEMGPQLNGIIHLVTPSAKSLQAKLKHLDPQEHWIWEEKAPSPQVLLQRIEQCFNEGKGVFPPGRIDLLYLRQTEAEREKAAKKGTLS